MKPDDLLQLLPLLITMAVNATEAISKIMAILKQSAELTPEQEKQFDEHIKNLEAQPWWQPDPKVPPKG